MLQCWRRTPPPRGIWQLKSPHSREFAIQGKKKANARGSARGGGGLFAGGIDWCIKTSFEIESQMTLDVVELRQFRIYGIRVQRFSHVLVKLIRYYDWYRLIVDFHKKSQWRDIFLVPVTCYVKHSLKSLFYVDRKYFFKRYISGFNSIL